MPSRLVDLCLPLVAALCLLIAGCDTFGGNGDNTDDEGSSLVELWNGTYEGDGQEIDFFGESKNVTEITPTLTIALRDTQALGQIRLSWNDGDNFAQTSGEVKMLTSDTLVTPYEEVQADSFSTRFQFRVGRDTLAADSVEAGGDSVRVVGQLRQTYENAEADSTIVTFSLE